jgi:hypothetical protein
VQWLRLNGCELCGGEGIAGTLRDFTELTGRPC